MEKYYCYYRDDDLCIQPAGIVEEETPEEAFLTALSYSNYEGGQYCWFFNAGDVESAKKWIYYKDESSKSDIRGIKQETNILGIDGFRGYSILSKSGSCSLIIFPLEELQLFVGWLLAAEPKPFKINESFKIFTKED